MAISRPWPSDAEGSGLEPPSSIYQTSTCSSGPGGATVSAAAGLLGRGLAAAVTGGSSLLRGSTASSSGGGGSAAGTPRAGAQAAAAQRPTYQLFAAFDGHNGAEAARFAEHSIVPIVEICMPPWDALSLVPKGEAELAAQLQQALALAFLELHRQFAMAGCLGGCTATVVLQVCGRMSRLANVGGCRHACPATSPLPCNPNYIYPLLARHPPSCLLPTPPPWQVGRLVTVAGVGSSRCLLFSGAPGEAPLALTEDHVIHTHLRERQRLLSVSY